MYDFININYLALSREMEFHADEVAANVAGFLPLKESLLRMDLADHSYNSVINFYENKLSENIKSENIYKEQNINNDETKSNQFVRELEDEIVIESNNLSIQNINFNYSPEHIENIRFFVGTFLF